MEFNHALTKATKFRQSGLCGIFVKNLVTLLLPSIKNDWFKNCARLARSVSSASACKYQTYSPGSITYLNSDKLAVRFCDEDQPMHIISSISQQQSAQKLLDLRVNFDCKHGFLGRRLKDILAHFPRGVV
jgi:hypothetical protein